ncbi:hypothetical protein JTB14_023037 [Gonioctena quinquepunctata]|nr:hypothetical protein JTB14_023037 [Gonioctena quinquepunctata]
MVRKNPTWIKDLNNNSAILCRNRKCGIGSHTKGAGFIALNFDKWSLINCYVSPNIKLQEFKNYIDAVMQQARKCSKFIIAGDLNAKSTLWNVGRTDPRGKDVYTSDEYHPESDDSSDSSLLSASFRKSERMKMKETRASDQVDSLRHSSSSR